MEVMRRGEAAAAWPRACRRRSPTPTPNGWSASDEYRWGSLVDASAVRQMTAIWDGDHLGTDYPTPAFTWVSLSLTDAAFHEGGPHSPIAEAAMARLRRPPGRHPGRHRAQGRADRTAVFVVADHGMEETAADVTGDWSEALRAAGIEHRDEASGFIYLGVAPPRG